ncbi:MAG TPA: hypothetical protein VLG14_01120 [Sphingomonas sp.]|nr:hypothetical protein [Sphingomonas sp.]
MTTDTRQDFLECRFWEAIARVQQATKPPLAAAYREAAQRYALALRRYDGPRLSQAMEKHDG